MKETENMNIWLEGGLRGEQEHGHDKKDFWDAVSTGTNCGRVGTMNGYLHISFVPMVSLLKTLPISSRGVFYIAFTFTDLLMKLP